MKWSLVKSPAFIICLLILLLNAFVLKDQFGNFLTGKLSDFTGLFVFALFWFALLPRFKKIVLISIGLFFIWWKSPLSQEVIDLWNSFGILQYSRTIDYWDLIAISVLPLSYIYAIKNENKRTGFNSLALSSMVVSCFTFFATSGETRIDIKQTFEIPYEKDTLAKNLYQLEDVIVYGFLEKIYMYLKIFLCFYLRNIL